MTRFAIWGGVIVLAIALVGPLLVPIPPLENSVPPAQLADPDSRFVDVDGLTVHYKMAGQGEPVLILLHGFGASVFSWREVLQPLGELSTVLAFDRPAFGLTERPLPGEWADRNPYSSEFQANLTIDLLDELGAAEAILVGNSAGGTIAALTALRYPDRIRALVLVDPAIYTGGGAPAFVRPLLRTPQMQRLGPYLVRSIATRGERIIRTAWHDPSQITPNVIAGYREPLRLQNWDRALWELTSASDVPDIAAQLEQLQMPVLVITGDDDRIVPTEESVRLARELPNARLELMANCGHVPQEECPEPFLEAVREFVDSLSE
jgi:pimeloyl-ACP methyl ester carboxylesterase